MTRHLPHPVLSASLVLMWLLLNSFSLGHLLLGSIVAVIAGKAMSALEVPSPRIRSWRALLQLAMAVAADVVQSNYAVASAILVPRKSRRAGLVEIPLTLREPTALSILAVVVTALPGTAWMNYDRTSGILLLHVFDLTDEAEWRDIVQNRYERLLLESFE